MSELLHLDRPDKEALAAATSALETGSLVVLPTDTVYGLAARPDVAGATARLFEAKRRPRGLTLPVLAASPADAARAGVLDERAERLADRFWPGGLTLVVPRASPASGWDLGDERETIGVRVPADEVALALLGRTGPLAVTSANLSGHPTRATCEGVRQELGESVAIYLCSGAARGGVPSTVVDLTAPRPVVLRPGAVGLDALAGVLGPVG